MNIVFDFDSTIITVESLDYAIDFASNGQFSKQIEEITNQGMNGEIDLKTSITKRLELCKITEQTQNAIAKKMVNYITDGMENLAESLHKKHEIFIVSGGMIDFIVPVAKKLKISSKNCVANEISFKNGEFSHLKDTPTLHKNGKSEALKQLGILNKNTVIIGDGFTDLEVHLNNPQVKFIGVGMNISRPVVKNQAKFFANSVLELETLIGQICKIF